MFVITICFKTTSMFVVRKDSKKHDKFIQTKHLLLFSLEPFASHFSQDSRMRKRFRIPALCVTFEYHCSSL